MSLLSILGISLLSLQSEVIEEISLDGNHIVIYIALNDISKILSHTLIDCSGIGHAFADEKFIYDHNLLWYKLSQPCSQNVINSQLV